MPRLLDAPIKSEHDKYVWKRNSGGQHYNVSTQKNLRNTPLMANQRNIDRWKKGKDHWNKWARGRLKAKEKLEKEGK